MTTPVEAACLLAGDEFTRHGRHWTVVDVVRGPWGCAHVRTVGGGSVFAARDEVVFVSRRVG